MIKYAVVLFNLGGPDSLESVEPFLYNLFSDRDIFKLPFGQKIFAKILSSFRVKKAKERYRKIGGKSPINEWTKLQRSKLQKELRKAIEGIDVYTAMRYYNPLIREAEATRVRDFLQRDPDSIVVVEVPLLAEGGRSGDYDGVVLVTAPLEVRLDRLVRSGRYTREEAASRIASQNSSTEPKRALSSKARPRIIAAATCSGTEGTIFSRDSSGSVD